MDLSLIQQQLETALADLKISNEEKQQFITLVQSLKSDKLSYFRNQSFDLMRAVLAENPEHAMKAMNVLQQLWRISDTYRPDIQHNTLGKGSRVYFSPGRDCRAHIVNALTDAKKSIDICVFTISDNTITDAILAAHQRGVNVRIISDNHKSEDLGSDIVWLLNKGVAVRMDKSVNHMHHKFSVIDQGVLINGSFNWTKSATERNQENIVVDHDKLLIGQFSRQFEQLWEKYR